MKLAGIKNIIFDLGNVIIDIDHNRVAIAFQDLMGDSYDVMHQRLSVESILNKFEVGAISTKEFISFFQHFKSSLTDQEIMDAWNRMLLDIPIERIALINELAKEYRIFLLSNTNEIHLKSIDQYVVDHFKINVISEPFEKAYFSHKMKLRKPGEAIFKEVMSDSNLKPEETLFIDDSEEHIITAKLLNLKTHHLLNDETILDIFNAD